MNQKIINGEQKFQILAHSMVIGQTTSGYTLMYSAGDDKFTAWSEATPANETCIVNNFAKGTSFYLSGNTDNVIITY